MEFNKGQRMKNFDYYEVKFKLLTPMLGTATETSIYHEHVLEKAKKEIAKANRLGAKLTKVVEKFKGEPIPDNKEISELQAVMRVYLQLLGKPLDVPNDLTKLLDLNEKLEEEFNEQIKSKDQVKATVFLRDDKGFPIISTHMILGNLKENLRVMVNNGDKSIIKSKVSVGETMALDVKPIEPYMRPDKDILRAKDNDELNTFEISGKGKNILDPKGRVLLERPIRFNRMGKEETAISLSEQLPKGTIFGTILRVRKESTIGYDALCKLFDLGKSNGLGAWRGSGNMGSYVFKLNALPDYVEDFGDWN